MTDSQGDNCEPSASDCEWTKLWGGGIGLRFTQPEGPFNARAAEVRGIRFELSGSTDSAPVQFLVADAAHPEEAFCVQFAAPGISSVDLSNLQHCGGGPLQLDVTRLTDLRWRFVNDAERPHEIENFCVKHISLY